MTSAQRTAAAVAVYLQPAVVGGGLGDIEEVLAVGRRLAAFGFPIYLYRARGRSLPRAVEGPWDWPPLRRVARPVRSATRAVTVTPWWGVSACPDAPDRVGASGPWSQETGDLEATYGAARVLHVSLEEFARTLTSRAQTRERWREGGIAIREIRARLAGRSAEGEVRLFRQAYRKWRAFDRANVLHVYATFRPSRAFAREFPEAVQVGPIWPDRYRDAIQHRSSTSRPNRRRWVWYASPSSAPRLAERVAEALRRRKLAGRSLRIDIRSPRSFELPRVPGVEWRWLSPLTSDRWARSFRQADLRIVTGSRTLLEALELGGPFLYFNGVLNRGARTRRHRPGKLEQLLDLWRHAGVSAGVRRDLAAFSRLRGVGTVVDHAVDDPAWSRAFPRSGHAAGFPPPWNEGGRPVTAWVARWGHTELDSSDFVRRIRDEARRRVSHL